MFKFPWQKSDDDESEEENVDLQTKIEALKENFKDWYGSLDKAFKNLYAAITILILVFGPFLGGFIAMVWYVVDGKYSIYTATTQPFARYILVGLFSGHGIVCTLIIWLISFSVFAGIIFGRADVLNPVLKTTEGGTSFAKTDTYGSALWMSKSEAKKQYSVKDVSEQTGWILGQFTKGGKESIASDTTNSNGNQNYLVIASPGRGKTFCMGYTNVMQALVRNESVCIVDPKGELCETLYNLFKEHGYITKVYNIVNPARSNAWNFCNEIFNTVTGNLDQARLQTFVDVVMTNTTDGEKEDAFWGPGERNLFQAGVALLGYKYEVAFTHNINLAADYWESQDLPLISDEDRGKAFSIIRDDKSFLREKEEALRAIMRASTVATDDEIDNYIKEIKEASDPITIDRVFGLFAKNDIAALTNEFEQSNIPPSHPASIAWGIFKHGDPKTQPNFIQGLTQRLKLFANSDINTMSAYDDIVFTQMGEKKTAIFCIISDKDSSRKLLSSLFFSFLFRDISDAADAAGKNNKRIPVNVMFDEFANIGRLPDFERFISTVRSRKIYICIIIQSIAQLAQVYDENNRETLIECCDTVVFLGCNGQQTAEFISSLAGESTIIAKSTGDKKNVMGFRGIAQDFRETTGQGKRMLITPDEVRRLPKGQVLIYHAGQQILKANSFGYIDHPLYKQGLPAPMLMATFPKTEDTYGEYKSVFDEISEVDITKQKMFNEMNVRLANRKGSRKQEVVDDDDDLLEITDDDIIEFDNANDESPRKNGNQSEKTKSSSTGKSFNAKPDFVNNKKAEQSKPVGSKSPKMESKPQQPKKSTPTAPMTQKRVNPYEKLKGQSSKPSEIINKNKKKNVNTKKSNSSIGSI